MTIACTARSSVSLLLGMSPIAYQLQVEHLSSCDRIVQPLCRLACTHASAASAACCLVARMRLGGVTAVTE